MKLPLVALAALPASVAAGAQTPPPSPQIIMPPASQPQIAVHPNALAPVGPAVRLPPGVTIPNCLLNSPPADAIVGEKSSGEAIVGEKSSGEAIVGEKSYAPDPADMTFGDRWNASAYTTFKHMLVGPPGKVTLNLYGCSSSPGGETVAVYLADSSGNRKTGWRHFVIATRNGNNREGTFKLPPAPKGESLSRVPIVIVVENASGKPQVGEYRLTVKP
jgi:hypothetical protein